MGERRRRRLELAAVALVLLAAGALLMYETRATTFLADDWVWVTERRGGSLSVLLRSYNGHFSLVPILVYKAMWVTAGLHSYVPYRLLVTALHLGCVLLLFVYARRRLPVLAATAAALLLLFYGPGWQDFLWPFQIAWLLSVGTGLAALLLLDGRGDRRRDLAACALLMCSLASSGPGVAIVAGVAVGRLLAPDRRRVWVAVVPLLVYAAWWTHYQDTPGVLPGAPGRAPGYVLHMVGGATSGLAGLLSTPAGRPAGGLGWGYALLAAGLAAALWRLVRLRRVWPQALALPATVLLFAVSVALNRDLFGAGTDSRYLYIAAVLILLSAVELARGVRIPPRYGAGLVALACAAAVSNFATIDDAGKYLRAQAVLVKGDLVALDIARPLAPPGYVAVGFPGWPFVQLHAQAYYAVEDDLGTPAPSPQQLLGYPPAARALADAELIGLHAVRLAPGTDPRPEVGALEVISAPAGTVSRVGGCLRISPSTAGRGGPLVLRLPGHGLLVAAQGGSAQVGLRRFGAGFRDVGPVSSGTWARLAVAPDRSEVPWEVSVQGTGSEIACGAR